MLDTPDRVLFSSPFSRAYWHTAREDFRKPRTLVFAALMIAACIALSYVKSIPIGGSGVRITWGFLARSVCGMVTGPVTALVFGCAEDLLSYLIHPSGPYFPGYALTTMLGTMIYALFLYRQRPTVLRVFCAKLLTNVLNVVLGSLWSAILTNKGYLYTATSSLFKNVIMLLPQTIILCLLFSALLPILARTGLLPKEMGRLWMI